MKILLILLITLISLGIVNAIQTQDVLTINECVGSVNITVSGSEKIDTNEYKLVGCNILYNNTWTCKCYSFSPTTILLETNDTTINNYTINAIYRYTSYSDEYKSHSSSGGSGGGSYTVRNNTFNTNPDICVNT